MKPSATARAICQVCSAGILFLVASAVTAQGKPAGGMEQFPSPMVEHTRAHPRLKQETPAGQRTKLEIGTLFLPEKLAAKKKVPLFVHFHGGTWLPEVAAASTGPAAVIHVQLGAGSGSYRKPFLDPKVFGALLHEAETKAGVHFEPIGMTSWSAGYGAIREIMKVPAYYERIQFVILLDGLHASYVDGKPGPRDSQLVPEHLEIFVQFAQDAVAGKKQFIVTHTEIFPGTFASTTETADYLLKRLSLTRQPTLKWGPMQTQQLSEVRKGKFILAGFAGNSAPDHVDLLHALPEILKWVGW